MFCHDESREGLIRVVQMLLHLKYDKYAVDAYQVNLLADRMMLATFLINCY